MNANVVVVAYCTVVFRTALDSTLRNLHIHAFLFVEVEVERHHHQINSDCSVQLSSQLRLLRFWALVRYSF